MPHTVLCLDSVFAPQSVSDVACQTSSEPCLMGSQVRTFNGIPVRNLPKLLSLAHASSSSAFSFLDKAFTMWTRSPRWMRVPSDASVASVSP